MANWESLDCKEIQPVHPIGDQSWVFIGRTDIEAETPILWPPDVKSWLILKDPHAGKDWGQEEKGTTEDEMLGWHYRFNGHGFGWTLGAGEGQRGLVCCGSWGCKESNTTEHLNWTEWSQAAFICLSDIHISSLVNYLMSFFHVQFELFTFIIFSFEGVLYNLHTRNFIRNTVETIFFYSMAYLFMYLSVSFTEQTFKFDKVQFSIFLFMDCTFYLKFKDFLLHLFLRDLLLSHFY